MPITRDLQLAAESFFLSDWTSGAGRVRLAVSLVFRQSQTKAKKEKVRKATWLRGMTLVLSFCPFFSLLEQLIKERIVEQLFRFLFFSSLFILHSHVPFSVSVTLMPHLLCVPSSALFVVDGIRAVGSISCFLTQVPLRSDSRKFRVSVSHPLL